jgi:hypothetical protein
MRIPVCAASAIKPGTLRKDTGSLFENSRLKMYAYLRLSQNFGFWEMFHISEEFNGVNKMAAGTDQIKTAVDKINEPGGHRACGLPHASIPGGR